MFFCLPIKHVQRQGQSMLILNEDSTVPISIYGRTTSKIAMLWTPEENWDVNLVSAKMAEELGVKIEEAEKGVLSVDFMGQPLETKGYVLLEWGVERSTQIHTTRFLVATAENSSFEVILGRRHAIEYGLVQS